MKEFFRKVGEVFKSKTSGTYEDEAPIVYRQRLASYAQSLLVGLYVTGEVRKTDMTNLQFGIIPDETDLHARHSVILQWMYSGNHNRNELDSSDVLELSEEKILGVLQLDKETKAAARLRALEVSLDYLEVVPEIPDISPEKAKYARDKRIWLIARREKLIPKQEKIEDAG